MKILLVGEFSGVHYELARAIKIMGHDITLMSDGDAYKKFKCDIFVPTPKRKGFVKILNHILYFSGIAGVFSYLKFKEKISRVGKFDVVQFINPVAIPAFGAMGNLFLYRYLEKRSRIMVLCALGDDYRWVSSCLLKRFKYSAMDRVFSNGVLGFFKYSYSLKYVLSPLFLILDKYVSANSDVIIPGLLDYKVAYSDNEKLTEIIPVPISDSVFSSPKPTKYPIKIFHGWQFGKEAKKGNFILDEAAKLCVKKYSTDVVLYEVVGGVSYDEYVKKFAECDIFLDQTYSYDRGVNGAVGMASGKVVFSGFESESDEHSNSAVSNTSIGVNAIPNVGDVYNRLCELVEDVDVIDAIKYNAYSYALNNYSASLVAALYIKIWSAKLSSS